MNKTNRALVLPGGGSQGAYAVGALRYTLGVKKREYSHVHGVSVGAVNGAGVAQWGLEAGEKLVDLWKNLNNSQVAKERTLGYASLAWAPSLMDVSPLRILLNKLIDIKSMRSSGIKFSCYAVDLISEDLRTWTQDCEKSQLVEGIMASSMAPIVYPAIRMNGQVLYDGGIRDVAPIGQAIAAGADEIDVILAEGVEIAKWNSEPDRVWNTAPRALQIIVRETIRNDLRTVELYNQLVSAGVRPDKRFIKINLIQPQRALTLDSRDFDPKFIVSLIEQGYADAKIFWNK